MALQVQVGALQVCKQWRYRCASSGTSGAGSGTKGARSSTQVCKCWCLLMLAHSYTSVKQAGGACCHEGEACS